MQSNGNEHTHEADVFNLVDEAGKQYEEYLEICRTVEVAKVYVQNETQNYTWDHPLTLTFNSEH